MYSTFVLHLKVNIFKNNRCLNLYNSNQGYETLIDKSASFPEGRIGRCAGEFRLQRGHTLCHAVGNPLQRSSEHNLTINSFSMVLQGSRKKRSFLMCLATKRGGGGGGDGPLRKKKTFVVV